VWQAPGTASFLHDGDRERVWREGASVLEARDAWLFTRADDCEAATVAERRRRARAAGAIRKRTAK
jgi:hypothetical protein